MKKKTLSVIFLVATLVVLGSAQAVLAQMQMESDSKPCETCTMTVGSDAMKHLKVTDANGTRHYVECIGCALKLLKTYDTIHIETYCDWYGPNYLITVDISQHGAVTTVSPSTTLLLMGGGCTGNRIAYNQTAADALLANGFSQYTMMMKQPLPANTNTTTISNRALTFAETETNQNSPQSPLVLILLGVIGFVVIVGVIVAYKKLKQ